MSGRPQAEPLCCRRPIPDDGPIKFNDANVATRETMPSAPKTAPAKAGDEVTVTWWRWYTVDHMGKDLKSQYSSDIELTEIYTLNRAYRGKFLFGGLP